MGLGKQAKTLSKGQIEAVLGYLAKTRHPAPPAREAPVLSRRLSRGFSVQAGLFQTRPALGSLRPEGTPAGC
jgi:hypothetical protein